MGTGIIATLPEFRKLNFGTPQPSSYARMSSPASFESAPELTIAIFLTDGVDLLASVLDVLAEGVEVADSDSPPRGGEDDARGAGRVRFSIDGSVSSVLFGTFFLGFAVRPVGGIEAPGVDASRIDLVADALEGALKKRLIRVSACLTPYVKVVKSEPVHSDIFSGRVFSEYRFGLARPVPVPGGPSYRPLFSEVAREFTATLGRDGIPLAYLYFPDEGTGSDSESDWIRFGVAADEAVSSLLEADKDAAELARKYKCVLRKYDPGSRAEFMGDRFRTIASHGSLDTDGCVQIPREVDVVYSAGTARKGYVAEMVNFDGGTRLLAGSMTVLAGRTVACWVTERGRGVELRDLIQSVNKGDPAGDVELQAIDTGNISTTHQATSLWVAWRSPDRPGVMRDIVSGLTSEVRRITGVRKDSLKGPDFRYSVSRVLADQNSCAGKIKFSIDAAAARAVLAEADQISRTLERRLSSAVPLLERLRNRGKGRLEIVLRDVEPGEEPWASLVVEANTF